MLSKLTIKQRMYLIIAMIFLLFGGMLVLTVENSSRTRDLSLNKIEEVILDHQKNKIASSTHAVALTVAHGLREIKEREARIAFIREALKDIRFESDRSGYFFVYEETTNVAHPVLENLQGKDLGHVKDKSNRYLVRELMARAADGGGFFQYTWPKPGAGETPKLGYAETIPGTSWWIGTGVYLDNIQTAKLSTAEAVNEQSKSGILRMGMIAGGIFLLIITLCLLIVSSVSRAIKANINVLKEIAAGDFTRRIDTGARDELSLFGRSFNGFMEDMNAVFADIADRAHTVGSASVNLSGLSRVMNGEAEAASERSARVAESSEEMSANMGSVSAAMEQASVNITQVASAAEEMTATIIEIASHTEKAGNMTRRAADEASDAAVRMNDLGASARSIDDITETIREISEQTNLLSLNATIEAARAGEAGKGFSVVADEIRNLARQTAGALTGIRDKVEEIQGNAESAVRSVGGISSLISDTDRSVCAMASAVEEQAAATGEIAENIAQVSVGIGEINRNVSIADEAARMIAKDVAGVSGSSREITRSSRGVGENAEQLSTLSAGMTARMSRFKVDDGRFHAGPVKAAHSLWRKKLSDLLAGKIRLRPDELSDHRNCEFGQWYFSKGMETYGHLAAFKQIDPVHRKVHDTAKQVAELYRAHEREAAASLFVELKQTTETLFDLLDHLEQSVLNDGNAPGGQLPENVICNDQPRRQEAAGTLFYTHEPKAVIGRSIDSASHASASHASTPIPTPIPSHKGVAATAAGRAQEIRPSL